MLSWVKVLGSSSKGCAYVLHFDNGKDIQLDAGVKNEDINNIGTLIISHKIHKDHDKYLKDFEGTETNIVFGGDNSFKVPHIVENYGYKFTYDGETICYITDCGKGEDVNVDLKDVNTLFIECNWDYFAIKNGTIKPKPHSMYAFSEQGHMSNYDCLKLMDRCGLTKDCKIIFVHKSHDHSNELTHKLFDVLPNKKYIARQGEKLYVKSWKNI